MSKRSDKRQARTEAKLRYGTTQDELTSILKGLKTDYRSGVKQARVGAKMVSEGAKQALPAAKALYGAGIKGNTASQQFVAKELQGLPADSPFRAAVSVGQGGAQSRLSEAMTMTGKELVGRRVDALAGGKREVESLRSQYSQDRTKTLDQLVSNAKQAGLYASSRYGELRGDAKKLAVTKRGQTLSHKDRVRGQDLSHQDRAASIQAQKDRASQPKPASPAEKRQRRNEINKTTSEIGKAIAQAKQLKRGDRGRHEAASVMLVGRPVQTLKKDTGKKDKNGKPVVQTIKVPAIDSFDQVIASVGLDIAYDGHVSKRNQQILRKRYPGVLKALGLPLTAPKKSVNLVAGIKVPTA
jgi:hypothetical protein